MGDESLCRHGRLGRVGQRRSGRDVGVRVSRLERRVSHLVAVHPPGRTWRGVGGFGPRHLAPRPGRPSGCASVRPPTTCRCGPSARARKTPSVLLLGTNPGHLFRSDDSGANWRELPIELVDECLIGKPRITRIRFDPFDAEALWVSAEIDAVHHSPDGGETWRRCEDGFKFPDIHDIAIFDGGWLAQALGSDRRRPLPLRRRWPHLAVAAARFALAVHARHQAASRPRRHGVPVQRRRAAGQPAAACCAAATGAKPGKTPTCRGPPTRRLGPSPPTMRTPTCCSPARTWGRCSAAQTAAPSG